MAKAISQETFDDVVQENIVDFSMSPDEAKQETINQFEAQGINLMNIIKDLAINSETGKPLLSETIDKLKKHIGEKSSDNQKLIGYLSIVEEECQKSLPHRVLAGKNGAHDALITLLEQELGNVENNMFDVEVLGKALKAIISLTNKQPDLFDAEALAIVLNLLTVKDENINCLTLQWLQKACIMHEMNRKNIVSAGVIQKMRPLLTDDTSILVIHDILAVFRYLVLDDDIRVEFGNAHEHARQIASEYIVDLTKLLGKLTDKNILADLLLTIGTLAVRQEFCTTIEDADGLKLLLQIMTENPDNERLNREALKLLRALAGNDTVKVHIVQQGAAPIIKDVLQMYIDDEKIVVAALACVSTLTLRVTANSVTFFETGIAETIVEAIRLYPKNKIVQRNGAWSIRNMVSRSRDQCETWMSYGVEELLNVALTEHPTVQQDIRAALRDLGCKVVLKEEWTGTAEKKIIKDY